MAFVLGSRSLRRVGIVGSGQIGPDIALHMTKVLAADGVPVVVVDIAEPEETLTWRLPDCESSPGAALGGRGARASVATTVRGDQVFWADNRRITVGEEMLKPRAQVRLSFATLGAE